MLLPNHNKLFPDLRSGRAEIPSPASILLFSTLGYFIKKLKIYSQNYEKFNISSKIVIKNQKNSQNLIFDASDFLVQLYFLIIALFCIY
jgi:hypothetical protein